MTYIQKTVDEKLTTGEVYALNLANLIEIKHWENKEEMKSEIVTFTSKLIDEALSTLLLKAKEACGEEAPHDECYLHRCDMCDSPRGWNTHRDKTLTNLDNLQ